MSSRIVWVVIAVGLAFVVAGVGFAGRLGTDPTVVDSALVGEAAPDVELAAFGGEGSVRTIDFAPDIVVANFWAAWCTGCREEHAALLAAAEDYADFGVTFLGINTLDEPGPAGRFLDEFGRGTHYEYAVDQGSRATFAYGVHGLPETFFIDRSGVVVGKIIGPVTYDLLAATLNNILLGEAVDSVKTGETETR
ncbi:MAG: redoxin domain-containing protein [Acidobacteria bacterium]|nr:redoxin domain-containing protein [Acidobacteriota bacterium]